MKRKSLLSLMLLCFAFFGVARADVVEVGEQTTTNSYLPTYAFYNYSLTQQIYTPCEIGMAGTISSIAFKSTGSEKTRSLDVYLVATDKVSFADNNDWITVTADDLVYSGNVTFPAGGWITLNLSNDFYYDGVNNLAVIVDDNTGDYSSGMTCGVFTGTGQAIRLYNDYNDYNPLAPPMGSGTVLNVKNVLQLNITPDPSVVLCCPPRTFVADNIKFNRVHFSWEGGTGDYNLEYKKASEDEWYTMSTDANAMWVEDLDPETAYDARIQSNCSEGSVSDWKTLSFTTPSACPVPTNVTVSETTAHGFTASFTPGDDTQNEWFYYWSTENETPVSDNYGNTFETTFTVNQPTNLQPETTYYLWIGFICSYDENWYWSEPITFTTAVACPAPTGLAVTADGQSATFTWTSDASSFDVAYATDGTANPDDLTYTTVNTNSYTKDNLAIDLDHYFWVRAHCDDLNSAWAGPASVHIGYCVPAPASVDNNGISNVTFGIGDYVVNNDTPKATYADYSSQIGAVQAGVESTIAITFKTGYTYNTYVWVDLDNSLGFDADEVVCYGESTNSNPTTLTLSFTIPADQTLGDFRLRIGSADSGLGTNPAAANPCYTGSYGCFQDYTLRVLEAPSCLTPTGLGTSNVTAHEATISWTSDAEAWQVMLNDDEENLIDVTENTYTFTLLDAETTYTAKVRTNCDGIFSDWTNAVSFTTAIACPAPTNLEVTVSGMTANFTWESDAASFDVAYSQSIPENIEDVIIGNPTTTEFNLTNFISLGDHNVWVRANCGSDDGYSQWAGPAQFHVGYCVPAPTSVDNNGISNVTFGIGDFVVNNDTPKATYADYSSQIGAVQAGAEATIAITFKTGYTYNTYVWVDLDNSLSFDADEVVCYGECTNVNPNTLTLNFTIPADQTLGDFRLRIGSADSGLGTNPAAANPCYTGSYGCFQDYTLRVLEAPSCLPPTDLAVNYTGGITAEVTWEGEAETYNIDVNGEVTEGVTSPYVLDSLEVATTYAVKVQANCGDDLSDWTNAVSFTTDLCLPENMCEITIELTDSYGDGWNGGQLSVVDALTEEVLGTFTLPSSTSSGTYTLAVCDGRDINFVYTQGNYGTENGWVITDVNGEIITEREGCNSGCNPTNGIQATYTVSCALDPCMTPKNLAVDEIGASYANLSWTGNNEAYNLQYRHPVAADPTATTATIILEANNVWGDGSGYQMLLDADATAYGTLWDASHHILVDGVQYSGGDLPTSYYDEFEYKLPTEADGALSTTNVVVTGSVTITIPAGTYDYAIFNPTPGDKFYIAADNGNVGGAEDDFVFEAGVTYHFTMQGFGSGDGAALEITPLSDWTLVENVTSPYNFTGLTPGRYYEWQVQGISIECEGGVTDWSETVTFITLDGQIFTKDITGYGTGTGNWYLIATPIDGITPAHVTNMVADPEEDYDLFVWDGTTDDTDDDGNLLVWRNFKVEDNDYTILESGKGYLYANKNTVTLTFAGMPYDGEGSFDLTYDAEQEEACLNLVGNPYAVTATIDADHNNFYTLNSDGDKFVAVTSNTIEAMEGIFVVATSDEDQVTFTPGETGDKSANLALNLSSGSNLVDRTIVRFDEGGQLLKYQLNPNDTKVYIQQEGKDYAVVNAPEMGEIPVSFKAESNGSYTLSFTAEEVSFNYLHLIDNMTGADVDLLETPSYSFNANTTDYASRFKLVFATGNNSDDNFAFFSNGSFVISNEGEAVLQVVDVTGRILNNETINGSANVHVDAAPGVYMLRLVNGDNVKVQKVVVR